MSATSISGGATVFMSKLQCHSHAAREHFHQIGMKIMCYNVSELCVAL